MSEGYCVYLEVLPLSPRRFIHQQREEKEAEEKEEEVAATAERLAAARSLARLA